MFELHGEALTAVRDALTDRERREQRQPLLSPPVVNGAKVAPVAFGAPAEGGGAYTAVNVVPEGLRFQSPEATGVPVPFRSSVVRLALFKLIGTGVLAALTAAGSSEPFSRKACAFAAAVNAVAVLHYYIIWSLRLQSLTNKPFKKWMIGIRKKDRDVCQEIVRNAPKAYVQEWAVTLVLLYLDLHALAEHVPNYAAPGPFLSSHVGAMFQVLMIIFGSITRFLCNNGRPGPGKDNGEPPDACPGWQRWLALLSFLVATVFFVLPLVNLMNMVGRPFDLEGKPHDDAAIVWVIMILQIGYPVISIVEFVWLQCFAYDLRDVYHDCDDGKPQQKRMACRVMPGDQYPPLLSLFKDLGYGSLDTLTKGGLALYVSLRAAR